MIPHIRVFTAVPTNGPGETIPKCARCGKALHVDTRMATPVFQAFQAQDIQVHWLTGERVAVELLPGLFHKECAQAELDDLPGVEPWTAAGEAFSALERS